MASLSPVMSLAEPVGLPLPDVPARVVHAEAVRVVSADGRRTDVAVFGCVCIWEVPLPNVADVSAIRR